MYINDDNNDNLYKYCTIDEAIRRERDCNIHCLEATNETGIKLYLKFYTNTYTNTNTYSSFIFKTSYSFTISNS